MVTTAFVCGLKPQIKTRLPATVNLLEARAAYPDAAVQEGEPNLRQS